CSRWAAADFDFW
nr:immunoglobulin heavy chain junction region [Macaca mulatta]